ncbi:MAG TPA: DUF2800 domain-containing protein [Kiritimatiellia bacterium]|nr:DUF2800 domain-containing protein [Kiritimatiellia bacterium]
MSEPYRWKLSPSKFEASKGCPCFEESQSFGKKYKDRGTDLHKLVEVEDAPLDGLDEEAKAAVLFCREHKQKVRAAYSVASEWNEMAVSATERHPRGKLDWVVLTQDGLLKIVDWKFGAQEVSAEDNPQLEAYALMAHDTIKTLRFGGLAAELPAVSRIEVGIVQPALLASPEIEIPLDDLDRIEADLKKANDRVTDPVKLPDASDPDKCKRCEHLHRCPAVVRGVALATHAFGLPMPENFDPGALVSDRDRVVAQDLATILEAWSSQVKAKNKEYAIANGGTIAGIYNVTTRSNGVELESLIAVAEALVEKGLLDDPAQLLSFAKLRKTELIEGLASPEHPPEEIAGAVKELEERLGVPRPPVQVFRRGAAKAVKHAEELLDVPQLVNPWKRKEKE